MTDTLVVKHLPSQYTKEEKENFLKHHGAQEVKILSSSKKYSLVFAKFENNYLAQMALNRLHQLEVLGRKLSVEFAKENFNFSKPNDFSSHPLHIQAQKKYEAFLHRLNTWHKKLDLSHPPPHYLFYNYPSPTPEVLTNICTALNTIPKFYTQVLHLMNKMNLPCPFDIKFTSQMEKCVPNFSEKNMNIPTENELIKKAVISSEEEESEIESEGENKKQDIIPTLNLKRKRKVISRPTISKILKTSHLPSTSRAPLKPEEVFEPIENENISKPIKMNLSHFDPQTSKIIEERFKLFTSKSNEPEIETQDLPEQEDSPEYISSQQLATNRLPPKEYKHLNVFKNYQKGIPSCRLYIKNIAKTVKVEDLNFIYRRFYIPKNDPQGTMFDIQYMNEGRLKGQAFITLQSVELAEKAIQETNGYILKDKPLVVQFARSAKKKEEPKS